VRLNDGKISIFQQRNGRTNEERSVFRQGR
jgi:hypothetical protein